jgi:hypothetical protein
VGKPVPPPIPGRRSLGGPGTKAIGPPKIGGQNPGPPGSKPITSSRGERVGLGRPPLVPVVATCILLSLELWLVSKNRSQVGIHVFGSLLGMFGSVVLLGWFRQSLNLRRSSNSFSDWSGPFESTRYMSILVAGSWVLGVMHLYFSVYELLRPGG